MKATTILALAALSTSLGGCKSFVQAFDFSGHASAPQYAIGPADLNEGRTHLRAGRVGNALAPLHRAALNPATSGEALNALGVAYAKLGRADLAERYFIAATRVDASNQIFTANLDRFYRSDLGADPRLLYAQRERAREQFASFVQSEEAAMPAPIDTRVVTSGGVERTITLSRAAPSQRIAVSRAPITAAPALAAPPRVRASANDAVKPNTVARAAKITVSRAPTQPPAARVRIGQNSQSNGYPVRVRLPARGVAQPDR